MPNRTGRPPGVIPNGPVIHRLRVGLGLTAVQLGDQIGFHAQTVRRAERGLSIGDVCASRMAKALGVDVEDITRQPAAALSA